MFDVPALVGLSFAGLQQQLGPSLPPPAGFVDPGTLPLIQRGEFTDSTALFRAGALEIIVSYNAATKVVSDLILLGTNEDELMQQGKLQLNSEKYLILPVYEAHRPRQLMGLRIVSK